MEFSFIRVFQQLVLESGYTGLIENPKCIIMILISFVLLYLGIHKKFEPMLLVPIAFGMLLANLPFTGILDEGGLLNYFYVGIQCGLYPSLIFLGIGAMTDFGPLIARPSSLLLGAAAQLGIFTAFLTAMALGFPAEIAAAIGMIGGADGPTAILTASRLAKDYLPAIAIAAYSYMALIPMIQPPLIRLMTTEKERKIKMRQIRPVTKAEKVMFPIAVTAFVILLIPATAPLIGMLMLGNLFRECGVTDRLSDTVQNAMINTITVLLGISVGSKATGDTFLSVDTISIVGLGLFAFMLSTVGGLLFGKIMCKVSGGKINPIIGAAGVSAVPMAARIAQQEGQKADPSNFLLMHAMGPNVAGVIGSAVAAGFILQVFGGN